MEGAVWSEMIACVPYAKGRVIRLLNVPLNICEDIIGDAVLDTAQFIISGKFNNQCQTATLFYRVVQRRMVDFIRLKMKENQAGIGEVSIGFYADSFAKELEEEREKERLRVISNVLSKREKEVAKLVAQGKSNAVIAAKLYISEDTLRSHLKAIYSKMDIEDAEQVSKRVMLALKMLQRG